MIRPAKSVVAFDLVDANTDAIDRMLNLNVNVVMKNVHDVLPHSIERGTGDIVVTSSLAAHFLTPWEPVYASVQMGYKLLRPDCTPPGLQAGHPRWLDLARSRHQRASKL